MWEDFKLGIFQQQFLDNLDKLDTQIYESNLIVLLSHVLSICSERDVLCLLATMDFRCWWSCFPRRRSRYWMNGSSWIINLKRVGFSPAVKQLSPLIFRGAIISNHELSAIIKYIYQVKSCEANISQIWTIMQSKPFPSWPGDLFRSVALRGGEGTNHHCRGGLSSVSSRWKRPDLCFLYFFVAISSWHDVLSKSRLTFQVVSSFSEGTFCISEVTWAFSGSVGGCGHHFSQRYGA